MIDRGFDPARELPRLRVADPVPGLRRRVLAAAESGRRRRPAFLVELGLTAALAVVLALAGLAARWPDTATGPSRQPPDAATARRRGAESAEVAAAYTLVEARRRAGYPAPPPPHVPVTAPVAGFDPTAERGAPPC